MDHLLSWSGPPVLPNLDTPVWPYSPPPMASWLRCTRLYILFIGSGPSRDSYTALLALATPANPFPFLRRACVAAGFFVFLGLFDFDRAGERDCERRPSLLMPYALPVPRPRHFDWERLGASPARTWCLGLGGTPHAPCCQSWDLDRLPGDADPDFPEPPALPRLRLRFRLWRPLLPAWRSLDSRPERKTKKLPNRNSAGKLLLVNTSIGNFFLKYRTIFSVRALRSKFPTLNKN